MNSKYTYLEELSPSNIFLNSFLQEHRTSQLPLELETAEDDSASLKSDSDIKSGFHKITNFCILLNKELMNLFYSYIYFIFIS